MSLPEVQKFTAWIVALSGLGLMSFAISQLPFDGASPLGLGFFGIGLLCSGIIWHDQATARERRGR